MNANLGLSTSIVEMPSKLTPRGTNTAFALDEEIFAISSSFIARANVFSSANFGGATFVMTTS